MNFYPQTDLQYSAKIKTSRGRWVGDTRVTSKEILFQVFLIYLISCIKGRKSVETAQNFYRQIKSAVI